MKYLLILIALLYTHVCYSSDSLRTEILNGRKVIVHKVEQGQTLFSIARKYSVTVGEIKEINPTVTQIKTGSELYVPAKQGKSTDPIASNPKPELSEKRGTDDPEHITHKVMPGETLYGISKKYGIPVSKINEANQLGTKGIKTGQELIIPQTAGAETKPALAKETSPNAVSNQPQPIKSEKKTSLSGYPSITESGTARLDESMNIDSYQVLHKSAKPGTLIMLKNKETGSTAHAKVTGNNSGQELLVLNRKVYDKLEGKAKNLTVEVFYTPED